MSVDEVSQPASQTSSADMGIDEVMYMSFFC